MSLPLIEKASTIAAIGHKEQVRKHDGTPYIVHPFMCAMKLQAAGADDITIAAALVHDVIEDTDIPEAKLRADLGDEVVDIVHALSEPQELEWEERKLAYIEQIRKGSDRVKAVSLADKVHNMENMLYAFELQGESLWDMFNRGKEKKLWFEQQVLNMLEDENFDHPLLEEYRQLVATFETLD